MERKGLNTRIEDELKARGIDRNPFVDGSPAEGGFTGWGIANTEDGRLVYGVNGSWFTPGDLADVLGVES